MVNSFIQEIINLNKDKTIKSYKNGEIIFFEDQPCECASIILKGSIYMSSMYNDKEIKFNFLRKNSMFGHNLLFNQNLKYKAHIIAVGNTKILHLNKEEFLKSLQNPNILEEYLKYMSWFTINDKEAIKILKIQKLEDRIFYILNTNKKVYRFKNISQFSILLGVSRETLSREITKLTLEGKIKRIKNTLYLM